MEQMKNFRLGAADVHIIPTATFKTNTFIIQMNAPLIKETASKRALLPNVLQNGTADYTNRQQIRSALDELYGASLTTDVTKKGERHIISFRMDIANEKFLKDQTPLMERGLKLLSSVLLNPKQSNNKFDPKIVAEEKRSHKQKIASIYDDKMRFANKRLTEEMCKEEPFGIHVFGQEDDLDNLNEANLYEYYKQALQEDQLDIYVMGDVDVNHVKDLISTYFPLNQAKENSGQPPAGSTPALKKKAREVVDEQSVQQGKLHIGYRTNVVYGEDDYFALQLFNGLFGGFSHSKLFINVREKASLAYYAASRVESFKGLLIVMSGIQSANYEKATDIIFKQMEEMKEGKFTEDDLQQTKAVYKNQILETMDVPRGRIELEYHNQVSPNKIPLEEWIDRIDKVTKEDIVKVAGKIQLDTIYFLKGREALSNE